MKHVFMNDAPVKIDRFLPTDVASTIELADLPGRIARVTVTIDVHHTYTSDLQISLRSPEGKDVLLVGREGGSGNHFIETTFDDGSTTPIQGAAAPFSGTFTPESPLADLNGQSPNGTWTLRVRDAAYLDGGFLNR